jgi:hypothetical protein
MGVALGAAFGVAFGSFFSRKGPGS